MKTEILTKDNIDKVVMSYCIDGRAKLLGINVNFDYISMRTLNISLMLRDASQLGPLNISNFPSNAFSENYANKQYILAFPNGYCASLVTNTFVYGGYEVALTDVEELYNVFDFIRDLKPRKKNKVRFENFGI